MTQDIPGELKNIAEMAVEALEDGGESWKASKVRELANNPSRLSRMEMHTILRTYSELVEDEALSKELDSYRSMVDRL